MDFVGWLRTIYDNEPMAVLPSNPNVSVKHLVRNRWLALTDDGYRVTDDARRLFGWSRRLET